MDVVLLKSLGELRFGEETIIFLSEVLSRRKRKMVLKNTLSDSQSKEGKWKIIRGHQSSKTTENSSPASALDLTVNTISVLE
jgi:hypothetical protein